MTIELNVKIRNSSQTYTEKFMPEEKFYMCIDDETLKSYINKTIRGMNLSEDVSTESLDIIVTTKMIIQ